MSATTQRKIRRGDEVMFLWNGRWHRCEFLALYPEFHNCYKVRVNQQEYTVANDAMLTIGEYEQLKVEADRAAAAERYADLIQAWDAGAKTVTAIAVALKVSNFAIINRFKAAQRCGLLT